MSTGIPIGKREPHDEKTPEEVVGFVFNTVELYDGGYADDYLRGDVMDALVYKAYFEEADAALRWLDPTGEILRRVLDDRAEGSE